MPVRDPALPQSASLVTATRSPCSTETEGRRSTVVSDPVTSNGPRSARNTRLEPCRRKNLIFTSAGQGKADQEKLADSTSPVAFAGFPRLMSVRTVAMLGSAELGDVIVLPNC